MNIMSSTFLNRLNDMHSTEDRLDFVVDFQELNVALKKEIVDSPEECITALQKYLRTLVPNKKKISVIFKNFSKELHYNKKKIHHIRSSDIGHLVVFDGLVRTSTDVLPRLERAAFEHEDCQGITMVDQEKEELIYPTDCSNTSCAEKIGEKDVIFREDLSTFEDYQTLQMEEEPEGMKGRQPERLECQLHGPFTREDMRVGIGDRVCIMGIYKIRMKNKKVVHEKYVQVIGIESKGKNYEEQHVTDEDIVKFEEMKNNPDLLHDFSTSIAPNIFGHDKIKESVILQMFAGNLFSPERRRGNIHIGIIGDPGVGKTKVSDAMMEIHPHVIRASGAPTTSVGLTAAAIQNPNGGFILEAGAAVLADGGLFIMDEFDKMDEKTRSALHQIMEDQQCDVTKAGIVATFMARCAILAIMNPKYSRFDVRQSVASQINLPSSLLSRFDLIFAIVDKVDKKRDMEIAKAVFRGRDGVFEQKKYSKEDITKYVMYARSKIHEMTTSNEAQTLMSERYGELRQMNVKSPDMSDVIPITTRQLEGAARLAEAHAKMRLSNVVEEIDAKVAIDLIDYYMKTMMLDENGVANADQVSGGATPAEKKKSGSLSMKLVEIATEDGWTVDNYTVAELQQRLNMGIDKARLYDMLKELEKKGGMIACYGENRIKIHKV